MVKFDMKPRNEGGKLLTDMLPDLAPDLGREQLTSLAQLMIETPEEIETDDLDPKYLEGFALQLGYEAMLFDAIANADDISAVEVEELTEEHARRLKSSGLRQAIIARGALGACSDISGELRALARDIDELAESC